VINAKRTPSSTMRRWKSAAPSSDHPARLDVKTAEELEGSIRRRSIE